MYVMLNDGGSTKCMQCNCVFHMCKNGFKYGSPGPSMCKECRPERETQENKRNKREPCKQKKPKKAEPLIFNLY